MTDRRERYSDPTETTRTALDAKQAEMWTALPGIVTGYNAAVATCTVQPAVRGQVQGESGAWAGVDLPLLVDVPVVFPRGGGFTLTYPIQSGDECLVVFSSRCIDGWWQDGGVANAPDSRMHDLSDGFALVGPRSQAGRLNPPAHAENVQLRSDDGETYVELTPGGEITAKAQSSITLEAPSIILKGTLSMQSQAGGNTTATLQGSLHATEDVTASDISLASHTHKGVQPGGGSTGGPQ